MSTCVSLERDAGRRALIALRGASPADLEESAGANQVLREAALTYLTGLGQRLGTWPFSR